MHQNLQKSLILLCLLISSHCILHAQTTAYYQANVYFKSGVTRHVAPGDTSATVTSSNVQAVLNTYSIPANYVYPAFPEFNESDTLSTDPETLQSIRRMNLAKLFTVTVTDTTTLNSLIVSLAGLSEVLFAEENGSAVSATAPDDAYYTGNSQQGLHNVYYPGFDIHAEGAWSITTGNPNSIIAIVDEGVESTHPDLQGKVVAGGDVSVHLKTPTESHGTEMASIAAANTNNAIGIAGVDWQAKILSEDWHDYTSCCTLNWILGPHGDNIMAKKITHAVNFSNNVWTINNSYNLQYKGGTLGRTSVVLREAFTYAYKKNRVSVASSGNDVNSNVLTSYPAAISSGVIAVGSSSLTSDLGGQFTYGPWMDVIAPSFTVSANHGNTYNTATNGTSVSSALVAGVASLIKGYKTDLYNDDIEQIIKMSADYSGPTPPFDVKNGYGRVNAEKALQYLQAPYQLQHLTASAGTVYATPAGSALMLLGTLGYGDNNYLAKKVEVRKVVTLPAACSITGVWGTGIGSIGSNDEHGICYGEGFTEVVPGTLTSTQVTLRTYIYMLYSNPNTFVGYYPCAPASAIFAYTVLSKPPLSIAGDNILCSGTSNPYTVANLPAGSVVNWLVTPTGIATVNSPGAASTTLTKQSNGLIQLTASVTGSCPSGPGIKNIQVGTVTDPQIIYGVADNASLCKGLTFNVTAGTGGSFQWRVLGGTINSGQGSSEMFLTLDNTPGNTYYIGLAKINECGVSYDLAYKAGNIIDCDPGGGSETSIVIGPNPSTSSITIASTDKKTTIKEVKILDKMQAVRKRKTFGSGQTSVQIDVSDLPGNIYYLQIFNGKKWINKVIQKN